MITRSYRPLVHVPENPRVGGSIPSLGTSSMMTISGAQPTRLSLFIIPSFSVDYDPLNYQVAYIASHLTIHEGGT